MWRSNLFYYSRPDTSLHFLSSSEFQTVTAGKFKRSLTPTKKIEKEDIAKTKEDVEMILDQFSNFVKQNRPTLDIDSVATGETWFGQAALEKGLCDEIKPVDDVLLSYVDLGYNVYEVEYTPPLEVPQGLAGLLASGESGNTRSSIGQKAVRWLVQSIAAEVGSVQWDVNNSPDKKYMARDDSSDRMQMRDP
jgi:ClpP class serine protease